MRTFPLPPLFRGGVTALTLGLATLIASDGIAESPDFATEPKVVRQMQPGPARKARQPSLAELRASLDDTDRLATLNAVHVALTQLSDGATFVWRNSARTLTGVVRTTVAFRNVDGDICRHLILTLTLGRYAKRVEGIACRDGEGRWHLS